MIFEIIKGQGYQKRIPLGNGLYAQIRRTEAEKLVIDIPYQGELVLEKSSILLIRKERP